MLANELITQAYYLSGIVSRQYETVDGEQSADGLQILNDLLASLSATAFYIPYDTHEDITAISGQSEYVIPNLMITEDVTFTINDVIYKMRRASKRDQFGNNRVKGVESLPYWYYPERVAGGTKIYLYFEPTADVNTLNVTGKYSLNNVTQTTDLTALVGDVYLSFLRYSLADWLCDYYNLDASDRVMRKLKELEHQIINLTPPDYTIKKVSTLKGRGSFNYAQANIGRGWTAP